MAFAFAASAQHSKLSSKKPKPGRRPKAFSTLLCGLWWGKNRLVDGSATARRRRNRKTNENSTSTQREELRQIYWAVGVVNRLVDFLGGPDLSIKRLKWSRHAGSAIRTRAVDSPSILCAVPWRLSSRARAFFIETLKREEDGRCRAINQPRLLMNITASYSNYSDSHENETAPGRSDDSVYGHLISSTRRGLSRARFSLNKFSFTTRSSPPDLDFNHFKSFYIN